ncbi:MAG: SH3 domain-containing protein [Dehalococcoidia bacterium]
MGSTLERACFGAALLAAAILMALADPGASRADHFPCHAPNRGWGFDTYEYEDYSGKYSLAIDLAVRGWAVPPAYTVGDGETIDVSYQGVESGPRGARQAASKANAIPPTVYKSIAWIESGWSQAAAQVPYGGSGPTITAIDCGYGLGQITTGMGHLSAPPALDVRVASARQAIIGTHPLFNIAEGVRILADKWNGAPNFRPIAGQGDPAALEDWYYAIWSYNGFAFVNHPLNPNLDPLRGSVWNCSDPNAPGYGFYQWGDYTYPEKVYGCMRYPPVPKGATYPPPLPGSGTTTPPATGGPKFVPGDTARVFGTSGQGLRIRSAPNTDATVLTTVPDGTSLTVLGGPQNGSGLVWWNVQFGNITGWAADQFLAKPAPEPAPDAPVNPAGRIWAPQVFSMPNLASPDIAAAMTPQVYQACEDNGFSGGCPLMDFATVPHYDSTPPPSAADATYFLGDPSITISGATSVALTAGATTATASDVVVHNAGTGIAPFRVRTSADWLQVRHPGDPAGRVVDGGVAMGSNVVVVTRSNPRSTTAGADSILQITVDPTYLTVGVHTGTVTIDPLLGGGKAVTFNVSVTSSGGAGGAPQSPTPGPASTPTPAGPVPRAVLPGVSAEGPH